MDENTELCFATFTGRGGWDGERERAAATFVVGHKYLIVGGSIGRYSSYLEIESHPGRWNSVLFDFDMSKAPLRNDYTLSNPNEQ